MPDGVYAAVQRQQAPALHTALHRRTAQPEGHQLAERDNPVLAPGQLPDRVIPGLWATFPAKLSGKVAHRPRVAGRP